MSEIIKIISQPISVNTYILYNEDNKQAVVIDPSFYAQKIIQALKDERLDCRAILLTHGHFDHISGVNALRDFCQPEVYVHEADADMLTDPDKNLDTLLGGYHIATQPAEHLLEKQIEKLSIAGMEIIALSTPGHSPGCVCYLVDDYLFSGDTLFNMSAGRTDLPGGNTQALYRSMETLKKIEKDYIVYPGHESSTSLHYEKDNNPFMGNDRWSI